MFKQTSLAFFFDIGGLFAGFLIASYLGVFHFAPWAIALYPAMVSAKGVINGLLSGRLGTALHLGTIYPRFKDNTKSFYKLFHSVIVLTLITATVISLFSLLFGTLFWGIGLTDYLAVVSVIIATMGSGLFITLITVKVAFISFKKGLDPDIIVYPIMSTVADILITLVYIIILSLFFSGVLGQWAIAAIGLGHLFFALYLMRKNIRETEFVRTIKESMLTVLAVALMVNITGTILKSIDNTLSTGSREIYTVYPALIDMIGDVGSVVGSTATTKLALGLLKPSFSSIKNHAKIIFSAWAVSIMLFIILAILSIIINSAFSWATLTNLVSILLISNVIAVTAIVLLSYAISILTFKRGLDPDNFVIPIESSFADSVTTISLLVALLLIL